MGCDVVARVASIVVAVVVVVGGGGGGVVVVVVAAAAVVVVVIVVVVVCICRAQRQEQVLRSMWMRGSRGGPGSGRSEPCRLESNSVSWAGGQCHEGLMWTLGRQAVSSLQ